MQTASDSKGLRAAPPETVGQGDPDVVDDLRDAAAQLPPRRRVRHDRRPDGDFYPAERPQPVSATHGDRTDGNTCVESEESDPNLQRPEPAPAGVAAFRKDQDDSLPIQDLVDGSQPRLVELTALGRDWKNSDQRQQPAFPARVEDRLALGHRVDHRG